MHIKKIEIEGFKSYVRKTTVDEFDTQFNAITGLNGTGKSNILDSICFVLGITNLSCIRAQQLIDLVYKQGQAGVNKAVVSIYFDNSDKKVSPIGYHAFDEIIVRRQIIVNGRNTYTINGISNPQNKVADFFRSVGLNVNNPHFLIMQGRITKVLNMKPHEILAMLEEAAGTKIYDAKRDAALEIIQKKENKINEINQLLDKDILPTLEKLRNDREIFIEYQKLDTKIMEKERRLNAFVYYHSKNEEKLSLEQVEEMIRKIDASRQKDEELKEAIVELEAEYKVLEDARSAKDKDEDVQMTERAAAVNKELAKIESDRDTLKAEQKRGASEIKRLEKANAQDTADMEKKRRELIELEGEGSQEQKMNEAEERAEKARTHLAAVMQGMTTDQEGNAITVEAQINQTKERLSKLTTDLKKDQTREKQLRPELDEKRKEVASMSKQVSDKGDELDSLLKEKTKLEKTLGGLSFDENQYDVINQRHQRIVFDKQQGENRLKDALNRNGHLNFQYNRQNLPASFDPSKVMGYTVRHFVPNEDRFNLALEVAGGARDS
ncbi:unnamed protein product, partial [Mesorhabditis belari]|uniref:RecF/RecN/SMC N-terminal domain-containing protein n=1 Tax=Mesorhabditis belari TaxID=2138241 RepID=A0AAF3EZQ7_9BILA